MIYVQKISKIFLFALLFATQIISSKTTNHAQDPPVKKSTLVKNKVNFWMTKGDQSVLLQKQNVELKFGTKQNTYPNIEVNTEKTYQTIDGFGYTLTGGSAEVINQLNKVKKSELLQELFGSSQSSIAISYLRISIGASDLNALPFSYDDMPTGETDMDLAHFSLAPDQKDLIPLLKEILAINPNISFHLAMSILQNLQFFH